MENILAIDDDDHILRLLQEYLESIGYEVKTVNDSLKGIKLFDNDKKLDLVITDIQMPGLSGNDVAMHIRKSKRGAMPIIAITGSEDAAIQKSLFNIILKKFNSSCNCSLRGGLIICGYNLYLVLLTVNCNSTHVIEQFICWSYCIIKTL